MDTFDESPAMTHFAVKLGHWNLPLQDLLNQVAKYRNIFVLISKMKGLRFLGKNLSKLYIIGECSREYFVSYLISKVLRRPQGSTNSSVSEAYLVRKWVLHASYIMQLEALPGGITDLQGIREVKDLTPFYFQLSFFIWGF
jgi:hypothetical protein